MMFFLVLEIYLTSGVLWSHWFSWATFYYCLCLYYYHCQYYHYYYDRPTSTPVVVDGNRGMRYSHSQGDASPPRHRRPSRRRWLGMAVCGPNLPSRVSVSALCHPRRGGGRGAQPVARPPDAGSAATVGLAWRHHDRGGLAWRHHDRGGLGLAWRHHDRGGLKTSRSGLSFRSMKTSRSGRAATSCQDKQK